VIEEAQKILNDYYRRGPTIYKGMGDLLGSWILVINNQVYGLVYPNCSKPDCYKIWRGKEKHLSHLSLGGIKFTDTEGPTESVTQLLRLVYRRGAIVVSYQQFEEESGIDLVDILTDWQQRKDEEAAKKEETKQEDEVESESRN